MKKIKWIIAGVILLVAGVTCWNYIVKNERDKRKKGKKKEKIKVAS